MLQGQSQACCRADNFTSKLTYTSTSAVAAGIGVCEQGGTVQPPGLCRVKYSGCPDTLAGLFAAAADRVVKFK